MSTPIPTREAVEVLYSRNGWSFDPNQWLHLPSRVASEPVVPGGPIDWSAELVHLRALVADLPHDQAPGTPSTAAARHFVDVGHRLEHGCCLPPATL